MKRMDFIEKWIANVLNVVGLESALHFMVCAWIVTYGHVLGTDGGALATFIAIILSVLKEFVIDEKADYKDLMFDGFGIIFAWMMYMPVDMLDLSRFTFWY